MLTTVEGQYSNGQVTLLETPDGVQKARVLVTFLTVESPIDHKQMVFGQFSGDILPAEEDFKIAEWHGEEDESQDGG